VAFTVVVCCRCSADDRNPRRLRLAGALCRRWSRDVICNRRRAIPGCGVESSGDIGRRNGGAGSDRQGDSLDNAGIEACGSSEA
jgi:hypothetical protein